jgi:small subunit ribosomal protein S4
MTKIVTTKYKIDRRLGINLWGRPKSPFNARAYGPGQHGQRRSKPTDYGIQLMAKQKLKGYYGRINERQFRRLFDEAVRRKGDTSENLIALLESRLDAVVYRACFAVTIFAARQLVSHKHITVNGKVVNIASYQVQEGDIIAIRDASKDNVRILEALQNSEREVPSYLDVNTSDRSCRFIGVTKLADVPYPVRMEPSLVVEFYSKA